MIIIYTIIFFIYIEELGYEQLLHKDAGAHPKIIDSSDIGIGRA